MKDCKKIHPQLAFYIEEQLSAPERQKVEKHLGLCEEARAELEASRNLLAGLRNMPEPPLPPDLHEKIMRRLGATPAVIRPHPNFWKLPVWALSAAAVLVFILLNQYPHWQETLQVQKSAGPKEEFAPQPGGTQGPAQNAPPSATAKAPAPVRRAAARKEKTYADAGDAALSKDKKSGWNDQELSEKKPEATMGLASAETHQRAAAVPAAPARMARRKAEEPAAPAAAMAPAPADEAMDQSVKSLTYSKEQEVQTWNGNNGPSTVEHQELVTDAGTFQDYWRLSHPREALPAVDFTGEAVVVLMAGERPTAGYSILVSRLEEKTEQLVIHYRVISPAPDAVTAQIITHPWAMQVISKPSKPVVFVKDN